MIPADAIIVLRGVKPVATLEMDNGQKSMVRNWRCEQYFMLSEQDAAEAMCRNWLVAGVRHVTLTAETWNGKFWRFNPQTGKWPTLGQAKNSRKKAA